MTKGNYDGKLTNAEVIKLFTDKRYLLNEQDEIIGKFGKISSYSSSKGEHQWVRLFCSPKFRSIPVSHVVWMVHTGVILPKGFEVHHFDFNPLNNQFANLLALYPLDHDKFHRSKSDEVPF